MLYRSFPKIPSVQVSALGLGTMRLPVRDGVSDRIDREKTEEIIRTAWEHGVTYYDTAYAYHGGKSEEAVGAAIKKLGIRNDVYIADKSPVWLVGEKADWEKLLDEQLKRLGTGHIDFYLLHALNSRRWETVTNLDGLAFLEKAKRDGKIRFAGFSFHDSLDVFKTITDGYDGWEFAQIQFNYIDTDYQAGLAGLSYAASKELGVIAMEPLRGGLLASPPPEVLDIFARAEKPRIPAEWALRWVWEHQEITCALSGMNSTEQVAVNCATASAGRPNSLPLSQMQVVGEAARWFRERIKTPCTGCAYRMPCPSGVPIPEILAEHNRQSMLGMPDGKKTASAVYRKLAEKGRGADKCVACGKCERACPQHIRVISALAQARETLA